MKFDVNITKNMLYKLLNDEYVAYTYKIDESLIIGICNKIYDKDNGIFIFVGQEFENEIILKNYEDISDNFSYGQIYNIDLDSDGIDINVNISITKKSKYEIDYLNKNNSEIIIINRKDCILNIIINENKDSTIKDIDILITDEDGKVKHLKNFMELPNASFN